MGTAKKKAVQVPAPADPPVSAGAAQRAYLREAADQIERGEPIEEANRWFVAGAVRAFADRIPDKPKRPPGQAPKFDHSMLAIDYVMLIKSKGMSKTAARDLLATRHRVSDESIKAALKKLNAEGLLRLFERIPIVRATPPGTKPRE